MLTRLLRPAAMMPLLVPLTALRLSHTRSGDVEKRSRRRYTAANTRGRVGQATDLLALIKSKPKEEAKAFYDSLLPRDKLDVVRLLHEKRTKRKHDRASSALPKHYSTPFEKNYLFREEDLVEVSTLGRGPGGQATNRRMQTAIVRHVPSSIIVKFSRFPSLWLNRRAARELLNLRLEEHLLGPTSRLGRVRLAREKRRRRRERTVAYLTQKGSRLRTRAATECHWAAFLEGSQPLPESVVPRLGNAALEAPVTIAVFFGSACNHWWPLLQSSLAHRTDDGSSSSLIPPPLLRYLFPAVDAEGTEQEKEELRRCATSDTALANVRQAFRCFCELFGLRVQEGRAHTEKGERRVQILKDGLNWVQYRSRLVHDGALTDVARQCCPRVYLSLRQLGLLSEARAFVVFLKKEAKSDAAAGTGTWAEEGLRLLAGTVRTSAPPANAVTTPPAEQRSDASQDGDKATS